jgi:hypothetical protein
MAIVFAFEEYSAAVEFSAIQDICALGVFSAVGFGVYHRNQTVDLIQYIPYDPTRQDANTNPQPKLTRQTSTHLSSIAE